MNKLEASDDAIDAVVCVLAAKDFLENRSIHPSDATPPVEIGQAKREGGFGARLGNKKRDPPNAVTSTLSATSDMVESEQPLGSDLERSYAVRDTRLYPNGTTAGRRQSASILRYT